MQPTQPAPTDDPTNAGGASHDRSATEAALQECDREPIRTPGSIQPHGIVVVTDLRIDRTDSVSANCEPVFGLSPDEVLASSPVHVLGRILAHAIRNVIGHSTIQTQREIVGSFQAMDGPDGAKGETYTVSVHLRDSRCVIEMIPAADAGLVVGSALEAVQGLLSSLHAIDTTSELLEVAVHGLRHLNGYDRVMAYRFRPDGSGEVTAESKAATIESLLGLRYPAWDIPPQARELYLTTPIRVIADVHASNVDLVSRGDIAKDIDLSLAALRGTSPIHLEYLRNMGVGGTMSLPIVVGGKLWGLIACHATARRAPDTVLLQTCELTGQMLSMILEGIEQRKLDHILRKIASSSIATAASGAVNAELHDRWTRLSAELAELIEADGVAYCVDGRVIRTGVELSDSLLACLGRELAQSGDGVYCSSCIREDLGVQDTSVAGVLAITSAGHPRIDIVFVRKAVQQSIRWAGNPVKDIDLSGDRPRLSPRGSFASFLAEYTDRCDEWTDGDLRVGRALHSALATAIVVEGRLGTLVRELNHRVRNILALVGSLASQTRQSAETLEAYATALENRIAVLAAAHNLLTDANMEGAELRSMIEIELAPYQSEGTSRSAIYGEEISIAPEAVAMVALVLHELATNAAKHGSLSASAGRVDVSWRRDDGLKIQWIERGGPAVPVPTSTGLGRSIIEHTFEHEFGGSTGMHFEPEGLRVELHLPESVLRDSVRPANVDRASLSSRNAPVSPPARARTHPPLVRKALVLEDNFVIAVQMKTALSDAGFAEVAVASTILSALEICRSTALEFAILDLNIRHQLSLSVAEELVRQDVPFLFMTGYGEAPDLVERFGDIVVLQKPVTADTLLSHVERIDRSRRG